LNLQAEWGISFISAGNQTNPASEPWRAWQYYSNLEPLLPPLATYSVIAGGDRTMQVDTGCQDKPNYFNQGREHFLQKNQAQPRKCLLDFIAATQFHKLRDKDKDTTMVINSICGQVASTPGGSGFMAVY